jgi:hypothetical protein
MSISGEVRAVEVRERLLMSLPGRPDARAVAELERSVLAEGGVVLSYGMFYGPGTHNEQQLPAEPRVQIDRAAQRTGVRSGRLMASIRPT